VNNPNPRFSAIFVAALAEAGLRHVVIAPGSRSTPLTLAFAAQDGITVHRHLDERGAAFFGLGLALALDAPVALVCTSGTAVANFLPAIVEANMSQVPLLLLTADRPPELRHSGANQTIDQVKIFGDQVLWAVDMGLPQADAPAEALRSIATTAVRAYAVADGLRKGPVHVNFPFRKPLEPEGSGEGRGASGEWRGARGEPFTIHNSPVRQAQGGQFTIRNFQRGQLLPTDAQIANLANALHATERGLIVCGPRCPGGDFPAAVTALARRLGWPIAADPLSGVRYGPWTALPAAAGAAAVLSGYETYLQAASDREAPQVVLRFGAVPTGKWLNAYLARGGPAQRIHVRASGVWADDSHQTTTFLQADETAVCRALVERLPQREPSPWLDGWRAAEAGCWRALDAAMATATFDGAFVADLFAGLPEGANLFVGNSLPVRHLDQYGRARAKTIHVYGNRGASGIDGNIAAGLGVAAATQRPTFILIGDVTAIHDLNSLLLMGGKWSVVGDSPRAPRHAPPATLIILNNNGGNIFRRLPVAAFEPPFTDLFLTPHGLTFEHAAAMFGLAYRRVETRAAFGEALATAGAASAPHLIEVTTDGALDDQVRRSINQVVIG
jgi:2-succinyl-5-enolpyruvyl-6-hydroxy-3-cyclohexene-1-carboxylate synthase